MKKHDILKTVQLFLFIALTFLCLYRIFTTPELYRLIGTNPDVKLISGLLWVVLGLSYLFIFLDYTFLSSYKKDYRELDYAVHSDPVAGIANRYSCDSLIERHLDKPLPANMGCIMLELTNIREINQLYGHLQGNTQIRSFSNILNMAQRDLCFVGRNGGNKFLALFEDCSDEAMNLFLQRVKQKVYSHNTQPGSYPIEYKYGTAFQENDKAASITDLIALSNQRIYSSEDK